MLLQQDSLLNVPIMSLQAGGELSKTDSYIIDPRDLTIVAFFCTTADASDPLVLHVSDIREVSSLGYIVDDSDKLMTLDNLVRLQEILDFDFTLINTKVFDDHGKKLGKVEDFSYEADGFVIEQLLVKPPMFRDIGASSHMVHRKQILSVTNEKIIVAAPDLKVTDNNESAHFVNPFRSQTHPEPESFRADRTSS